MDGTGSGTGTIGSRVPPVAVVFGSISDTSYWTLCVSCVEHYVGNCYVWTADTFATILAGY